MTELGTTAGATQRETATGATPRAGRRATKPMGEDGWEKANPAPPRAKCEICEETAGTKAFHNTETGEHVALCKGCYDNMSSLPTKLRPCECGDGTVRRNTGDPDD